MRAFKILVSMKQAAYHFRCFGVSLVVDDIDSQVRCVWVA